MVLPAHRTGTPQPSAAAVDKYMVVKLAGESYGLPLVQLREVVATYEITALPNLPEYFRGVIGLRREVIPILDLRRRFELAAAAPGSRPHVVVVEMLPNVIGIEVDEVVRVQRISLNDIEQAPQLTCGQSVPFVRGVSEDVRGKLIIHLDIQRILSSVERIRLAELGESLRAAYESTLPAASPPQNQAEEAAEPVQENGEPDLESSAVDDGLEAPLAGSSAEDSSSATPAPRQPARSRRSRTTVRDPEPDAAAEPKNDTPRGKP